MYYFYHVDDLGYVLGIPDKSNAYIYHNAQITVWVNSDITKVYTLTL